MARGRMIKPELWASRRINSVSLEANLLLIALFNFCDDFGLIPDSNRLILGNCFPFRESVSEKDIKKWKSELVKVGLLAEVQYETRKLLSVVKWEKHQTIMNRSKRNNIDNGMDNQEVIDTIEKLISNSLDTNYLIDKGKEKKDKGKVISEKVLASNKKLSFGLKGTIKLSQTEYDKLVADFSKSDLDSKILDMENYLNKGNKYKDHNLALRNWFRRDSKKNTGGKGLPFNNHKNAKDEFDKAWERKIKEGNDEV